MRSEVVLIFLFSVATAVALLTRRLKVPYTVALVVAGVRPWRSGVRDFLEGHLGLGSPRPHESMEWNALERV